MINIEWNYEENPSESGYYTVTVEDLNGSNTHVLFHVWYDCDFGWCVGKQNVLIVSAWAEDMTPENIEPYEKEEKEEDKFEVGDIVVSHGGFVGVVAYATYTDDIMYVMWTDGSSGKYDNIKNTDDGFKKIGSCTDEFNNVLNILEDAENKQ